MTRTVPSALQTHLDASATTTCRLLKLKTRAGVVFGLTTLDKDVVYDDASGDGTVTYVATNGFDPTSLSADSTYAVDNAEVAGLLSDGAPAGITVAMVSAGELDDARWFCYLVNFENLGNGHVTLDAGDLGEVRVRHGMAWTAELLSLGMRLRQPVGHVWSLRCRAVFGSAADSQTGCGVSLAALWTSGTVSSVGSETTRQFTGTAVGSPLPFPGVVLFTSGSNAGKEFAVESVAGLVVSLFETTGYPIQVGDGYDIRRDCGKRYQEDCIAVWANGANFKGEPLIPTSDAAQIQTPSGQTSSRVQKLSGGGA